MAAVHEHDDSELSEREAARDIDQRYDAMLINGITRANVWDVATFRASELAVDPDIQIDARLDLARVKRIAAEWDWDAYTPIRVGFYDDAFWIIDGWHRWEAAKERFAPGDVWLTAYFAEITKERAARIFAEADKNRVAVNAEAKLHALRSAGDASVCAFLNCTAAAGWTLSSQSRARGSIRAVSTAWAIWRQRGGPARYRRVLDIITQAWGYDPQSVEKPVLSGLAMFLLRYPDVLEPRLVERLATTNPRRLTGALADEFRPAGAQRTAKAVVPAIVKLYNTGLGSGSKHRLQQRPMGK